MSFEEKIGQLAMVTADLAVTGPMAAGDWMAAVRTGRVGSLLNLYGRERVREAQRVAVEETRLGIPLFFGFDAIHGHRTIFPIPLAEAGAFDPGLWRRTARVAAEEAAADGLDLLFAPMLDVCRDPRWGRIAESPGEDPWLAARLARARIAALEEQDLAAADAVAACAKHLGAYGAVGAGREYASVDVSERTLHEVHLPAFRAAVAHGVATIMPSFNDLAGIPATANAALLEGLVRGGWGFEGVLISDYGAVAELVPHGVAADLVEASALALAAGVDIDMMGDAYVQGLPEALRRGLVAIEQVDRAVVRVLTLKERLGLLDDPYRRCRAAPAPPTVLAERRALAREAARRSIVLLDDKAGLLPLDPPPRRLAVIGPLADAGPEMLGPWSAAGSPEEAVGLLDGLKEAFPGTTIVHARGVPIEDGDESGIEPAVAAAREADLVLLGLGERRYMSGEAASRARPDLPGRQRALAEAVLAVGKPTVALLSSGRPLMVPWLVERAGAVLATWFLGVEAGHAMAEILSGAAEPTGRLPVSWPVDTGQIPVFYAQRPTGRPPDPKVRYTSKYIDLPVEPLFPFGHGLSYTRFGYRDLEVGPREARPGDRILISVEVTNEGRRPGEETLFFFIRDPVASIARPVQELRGWQKVHLLPGERVTVRLALDTDALAFLGPDLEPRLEPGRFEIRVGPSADPARQVTAELLLREC